MGFAPATKNALIDALAGQGAFISLHTGDCGEDGANAAAKVSRVQATFPAAAAGESTAGEITFTAVPAGTYTHFGVWDAATAGNFIHGHALQPSVVAAAVGDIKVIPFIRFPSTP